MFVRALNAIAPILVFALVISSIANAGKGNGQQFRMVTIMYILGTLCAAVVAVIVDPLLATIVLRRNAYPLVCRCLRICWFFCNRKTII